MYNLIYGITIGVLLAMGLVELFMKPIVIYQCTETEKSNAVIEKLALVLDGDKLFYKPPPKPEVKPR